MHRTVLAVAALAALGGCHAKFKKHHHLVDAVRTEVHTLGSPTVVLGQAEGDDLVSGVINVVQAVKSFDAAREIAAAVDPDEMNAAFTAQLAQDLDHPPPFVVEEGAGALLEVTVTKWGMTVESIGAQGTFDYDLKIRVFMADGERIYTHHVACAVPVGDPKAVSQAIGTVNNKKQLDSMSKKAIREAFNGAATGCASVVASDIRRHAG